MIDRRNGLLCARYDTSLETREVTPFIPLFNPVMVMFTQSVYRKQQIGVRLSCSRGPNLHITYTHGPRGVMVLQHQWSSHSRQRPQKQTYLHFESDSPSLYQPSTSRRSRSAAPPRSQASRRPFIGSVFHGSASGCPHAMPSNIFARRPLCARGDQAGVA